MDEQDNHVSKIHTARPKSFAENVQRRTSKKSSSRDRHGRLFDEVEDYSIRAVTPESPSRSAAFVNDNGPHSPRSHPSQPAPYRNRQHASSLENTDEEVVVVENKLRKPRPKARSRDNDNSSDASPNSFISKARKRMGSITTNTPSLPRPEDLTGSIGFPSVISGGETQHDRLPLPLNTPHRALLLDDQVNDRTPTFQSPAMLDIDSTKILHLMKTTCGRMHGILFFKPMHSTAWASGYCAINVAPGSLVCQAKGDVAMTRTLIPDLRGCTVRTHYDSEIQSTYLSVLSATSNYGFQLRPPVPETFDSWLAALLCWQPLRPKGIHNKMTKSQPETVVDRRPIAQRRISDLTAQKGTAIVKAGKMFLWDGPIPSASSRNLVSAMSESDNSSENSPWRRVSCTLHENGNFKLLGDVDARLLTTIPLSQLSRCAVQRLHESVLTAKWCIALYPEHASQLSWTKVSRPVYLRLDTVAAFEAWYVLFRALTVPELYGPERQSDSHMGSTEAASPKESLPDQRSEHGMFRVERNLIVKVTEVSFTQPIVREADQRRNWGLHKTPNAEADTAEVYAEVILDRTVGACTSLKRCSTSAFWAEEFQLWDIPPALSRVCVAIKMNNPREKEWTMITYGPYDIDAGDSSYLGALGGIEVSSHDTVFGQFEVQVDMLEQQVTIEQWWPLLDNNERRIGKVLAKLGLSETVVLMEEQYKEVSNILHNFSNSLTPQIANILPHDLKRLSDVLLDIFQASGSVIEWISNLIEEEIDGIYKDTPPNRMRYNGRLQSNDSYESVEHRELLVRDLSRSATMEANLLFRGNSLVTKALDAHMRRLGSQYLEDVLGEKLRGIVRRELDCEVDPVKIRSSEQRDRNWSTLLHWTNVIWKAISSSASSCPPGMRILLKHIRSCADDRYGSFIRTVKYTSVSGFLFLRFFCPAILNPKLFGLIKDFPNERSRRTFTLLAKSLNVLANMSKFGTKEPWMEPMNKFIFSATPEFKAFIEEVCAIDAGEDLATPGMEPQYTAAIQVRTRLPSMSQEGLPTLPYLLDSPRLLGELVELWIEHAPKQLSQSSADETLRMFHDICLNLHQKSAECLGTAEQAARPNKDLERQWEQLLHEQQKNPATGNVFEEQFVTSPIDESELTALPQTRYPIPSGEQTPTELEGETSPPSTAAPPVEYRRPLVNNRNNKSKALTSSTNSSTHSLHLDVTEGDRSRTIPGSRDGAPKRLLDLVTSSSKDRKGRRELK